MTIATERRRPGQHALAPGRTAAQVLLQSDDRWSGVHLSAWLGREGSNLRMAESKSAALPLGYAPTGGIRYPETQDAARRGSAPLCVLQTYRVARRGLRLLHALTPPP